MVGLNKVFLIGGVTTDPETRTTASGRPVVSVTLTTRRARRSTDLSDWIEECDHHRLVAVGKWADHIARSVRKGDMLAVECCLYQRKWADKDGRTHYATDLHVDRVLWTNRPANRPELPGPPMTEEEYWLAILDALNEERPATGG